MPSGIIYREPSAKIAGEHREQLTMSDIVNSSLKTAAKGTAAILFGVAASNVLWFTTKFMIIRNTTVDQLGTYSMVIAVISVCSIIASLGVHDGATKYSSQFIGEGKLFEAQSVRKTAIQIGLISGFAACALLFLFAGPLSRYIFYKPALETPLKVGSFFIPFNILTIILVWILR